MNNEEIDGKFQPIKGKIKTTWEKLIDNNIALFDEHDAFYGKLKQRYGITRELGEKKSLNLKSSLAVKNDYEIMDGISEKKTNVKKSKKPIKRPTWPLNVIDMRAFSKKKIDQSKGISSWETEGGHA